MPAIVTAALANDLKPVNAPPIHRGPKDRIGHPGLLSSSATYRLAADAPEPVDDNPASSAGVSALLTPGSLAPTSPLSLSLSLPRLCRDRPFDAHPRAAVPARSPGDCTERLLRSPGTALHRELQRFVSRDSHRKDEKPVVGQTHVFDERVTGPHAHGIAFIRVCRLVYGLRRASRPTGAGTECRRCSTLGNHAWDTSVRLSEQGSQRGTARYRRAGTGDGEASRIFPRDDSAPRVSRLRRRITSVARR